MKKFWVMFVVFVAIVSFSLDIPKEFGKSKTVEYKVKVVMTDGIRIYYPQFSSEHRKLNEIIYDLVEKRWSSWEKALLEQLKIYKKGITAGKPEYYLVFSVKRFDDRIISILFEEMAYTGGAHPMNYLFAINYDLAADEELSLKDLFIDGYNYKEVINKRVKEFFEVNKQSVIAEFRTIKDNQDFYLTDYGIIIFFQRYEYTCYAFGNSEIPIPYRVFEDKFKREYLP